MFVALDGPRAGEYVGRDYEHAKRKAFDSQREFQRWRTLDEAQRHGLIHGLRMQVRFPLNGPGGTRICFYVCDFLYIENGNRKVEDVKSSMTRRLRLYRIKKAWMKDQYDIDIIET